MKTFVTTQAAGSSPPTDAQFEELSRKVAALREFVDTGMVEKLVADAVRPYAAEIALSEKEQLSRAGARVNTSNVRGQFRLPAANDQ